MEALNNAQLAMMRWDRLDHFKEVRGDTLRQFVDGLVGALTKEILHDPDNKFGNGLLVPSEELALALQSATVLFMYQTVEADPDGARLTFLDKLVTGKGRGYKGT